MTKLAALIARRIRAEGPMSVAEYMSLCLTHREHGYYTTRDPLGAAGDFTTAPEISQMFGELVGLALAQCWMDQGAPAPFVLAELGPGRGTLMADALRATRAVPGFQNAMRLELVEASPELAAAQSRALEDYAPRHVSSLADLSDGPLFLIANEFFDALPIRQFLRTETGWAERVIGLGEGDALQFGLTPAARIEALEPRYAETAVGEMVELGNPGAALAAEVGRRVAAGGGAALIIDYGDWSATGDTFQAVRSHEKTDPLAAPGQADLTAHVDFAALGAALPDGARASAMTPQGVWLERLGITARANALAQKLTGAARQSHVAAHRRLTHGAEMGELFKVLGIVPATAPLPPGLDA